MVGPVDADDVDVVIPAAHPYDAVDGSTRVDGLASFRLLKILRA